MSLCFLTLRTEAIIYFLAGTILFIDVKFIKTQLMLLTKPIAHKHTTS